MLRTPKIMRFCRTILLLFIAFNALKITLFNGSIVPLSSAGLFATKFITTFLALLIFFPLLLVSRSRLLLLFLCLLQTVYIITTISYFLCSHGFLQLIQWGSLFQEAIISAGHAATPQNIRLLTAVIDVPLLICFYIKYPVIKRTLPLCHPAHIALVFCSLFVLCAMEASHYLRGNSLVHHLENSSGSMDESAIVLRYGTLVNSLVNLSFYRNEHDLISSLKYGPEQLMGVPAPRRRPNFVFIQIESMDSAIIAAKYKDVHIAPFLHSLIGHSVYYPYSFSYHIGGGTSDSEFSIINSVEPLSNFPAIKLTSYDYPNSMLKRLTAASYRTMAFHGNRGKFYDRDRAFPRMGFAEFHDLEKMAIAESGWGAPDHEVFDYALTRMQEQIHPFFSFIITMSSHTPYKAVASYFSNRRFDDIDDKTTRHYFNSISYVDDSLRMFIAEIRRTLPNTYIFIQGDHDASLANRLYSGATDSIDGNYLEYVPLFIITPDNQIHTEHQSVASFLDIAPTVLTAAGINCAIRTDGQDLLRPESVTSLIPYKKRAYRRDYLYSRIAEKSGRLHQ